MQTIVGSKLSMAYGYSRERFKEEEEGKEEG